jgi:hypothetical protein
MMIWVILIGSIVAGMFPFLLPLVYRHPALTVSAMAFLLAVTAGIEYALRLRVAEAIGDLEFRS